MWAERGLNFVSVLQICGKADFLQKKIFSNGDCWWKNKKAGAKRPPFLLFTLLFSTYSTYYF